MCRRLNYKMVRISLLPKKVRKVILFNCNVSSSDFPRIVVYNNYRFTYWTKYDPVMIEII